MNTTTAALASGPFATSRFPDDARDAIAGPLGFHRVEILAVAPGGDLPAGSQRLGNLVVTITPVPRWNVPDVLTGPQPAPVETSYFSGRIERRWVPGSTRHCRLCRTCVLTNCSPSRVECQVDVDDATAELLDAMEDQAAERAGAAYSEEGISEDRN